MSCHYFIESKKRRCLKRAIKGQIYCKFHEKINNDQIGGNNGNKINQYVSPYVMISSQMPPDPAQQSWYHYQAPIYQSFGDYICIKKSFINETKNIINNIFNVPQKYEEINVNTKIN